MALASKLNCTNMPDYCRDSQVFLITQMGLGETATGAHQRTSDGYHLSCGDSSANMGVQQKQVPTITSAGEIILIAVLS